MNTFVRLCYVRSWEWSNFISHCFKIVILHRMCFCKRVYNFYNFSASLTFLTNKIIKSSLKNHILFKKSSLSFKLFKKLFKMLTYSLTKSKAFLFLQTQEISDENKSIIWFLIKQVRPGMDLSKVVLPTFILEPRSFLEKLSDYYYHADLLAE